MDSPELQGLRVSSGGGLPTRPINEHDGPRQRRPLPPRPPRDPLMAAPFVDPRPRRPPHPRSLRRFLPLVALVVVLLAVAIAGGLGWLFSPRSRKSSSSGKEFDDKSSDSSSWGSWLMAFRIIWRLMFIWIEGQRLVHVGAKSLVQFLPPESAPYRTLNSDEFLDSFRWVLFAAAPVWSCVVFMAAIENPTFREEDSINQFLPAKTRDDIKGILDMWISLALTNFKMSMGVIQGNKWSVTVGGAVAFVLSVVVVSTSQLLLGKCVFHNALWNCTWPIFGTCFIAWLIQNGSRLLAVRRLDDLGTAQIGLASFIGVLYLMRWAPVEQYCKISDT